MYYSKQYQGAITVRMSTEPKYITYLFPLDSDPSNGGKIFITNISDVWQALEQECLTFLSINYFLYAQLAILAVF